jgi:hypothetical protein
MENSECDESGSDATAIEAATPVVTTATKNANDREINFTAKLLEWEGLS